MNELLLRIRGFVTESNKLTLIYAIFMAVQVLGFVPNVPQVIVYAVLILFAFTCIMRARSTNYYILALLAYIPLEILIANPPSFFSPWLRYFLFALLLLCVSPLLQSETLREQRVTMLRVFLWTAVVIGVGSFFAYYLGINYMKASQMDTVMAVGTFGGLTTHSMLLGPLAGVGALFLIYKAYAQQKNWYWLFAVLCIATSFMASSRTAVLAVLGAATLMIYKMSGSGGRFAQTILFIVLLAAITYPLWESLLSGIMSKQAQFESQGQFGSRTDLWLARLKEIKENPVFGVGFVSTAVKSLAGVDTVSGRVESGSSWLIIPSMLGLVGTIIVVPFFIKCFRKVWVKDDMTSHLCLGLLTFYFIHMVAEGYIFAGGSYMCFGLWLVCGCCVDRDYDMYEDEYEHKQEKKEQNGI